MQSDSSLERVQEQGKEVKTLFLI